MENATGKPLKEVINNLLDAVDGDKKQERAKEIFNTKEPSEEQMDEASKQLANEACESFDNPQFRNKLMEIKKKNEQTIDTISRRNKRMSYERDRNCICTIGYEGKTVDFFFYELIFDKVNTLLDVRSRAFSRKFGFSKGKLTNYLERLGIEYIHIPELGIPPSQRKELKTSSDYQRVFPNTKGN